MHTLAAVALNLGALQAEPVPYGEALARPSARSASSGASATTAELGSALFNAANLFVQVGSSARLAAPWRAHATRARAAATGASSRHWQCSSRAISSAARGSRRRRPGSTGTRRAALGDERSRARGAAALLAAAETLAESGCRRTRGRRWARQPRGGVPATATDDDELALRAGACALAAGAVDPRR